MKRCNSCGLEYPLTPEFWYRNRTRKNGFQSQCKACHTPKLKAWQKAHPEHSRARAKAHYDANPVRGRARSSAWQKAHPEAVKARKQRRRARKLAAGGTFTADQIRKLYELQKGRCWWNTKHKLDSGYHADHRIALSRGGTNDISNIVLTCPHCNTSKKAKMPYEFAGRLL